MMKKRNAFTLVELLAVIVILAIILVIAVPKVMSIIKDAKKGTLETTAKMIASAAEKKKLENTILENDEDIDCDDVADINSTDYPVCKIDFEGNTAKVTITGGGQFEGLHVCEGTKTLATATEESCTGGSSGTNTGVNYIENLLETAAADNGLIVDDTADKNIRYAGPLTGDNAVKNQVYFNCAPNDGTNDYGTKDYKYADKCETWRIIGVFDTKSTKDENEKPVKRIKIVKNQVLSTYLEWDTTADGVTAINQWGETTLSDKTTPYAGASLMQYLNGDYHNSLTSIAQGQIDDALWYTGAVSDGTASEVYAAERSEAKGTGTTVVYTTTWVGKIGLIYPSDFGYAGTNCGNYTINNYNNENSCGTTRNWLPTTAAYRTISPSNSSSDGAGIVYSDGFARFDTIIRPNGVRPSVYLKPGVKIIGGEGTTNLPYTLSAGA